jgi:hypothetical protein
VTICDVCAGAPGESLEPLQYSRKNSISTIPAPKLKAILMLTVHSILSTVSSENLLYIQCTYYVTTVVGCPAHNILPLFHLHGHCHYPSISLTISPYLLYFSIIYKPTAKLFLFDIPLSDCHHQADSNGSLSLGHCMIA